MICEGLLDRLDVAGLGAIGLVTAISFVLRHCLTPWESTISVEKGMSSREGWGPTGDDVAMERKNAGAKWAVG